jgi:chromosome segregation ATPase
LLAGSCDFHTRGIEGVQHQQCIPFTKNQLCTWVAATLHSPPRYDYFGAENKKLSSIVHPIAKDKGSMTSNSKITLNDAIAAMESAYARLAAATDIAVYERANVAAQREALQQEISQSWQEHSGQLEAALAEATSENEFLRQDNLRLSNQLQQLQKDYLELQTNTGHVVTRLDNTVRQLDLILEH